MRYSIIILFIGSFVLTGPSMAGAHEAGVSLEGEHGEYLVDIGYNPERIVEGESVVFDFNLKEADADVEFNSVWVRMNAGERTMLATGIGKSEFGRTVLTYAFPEAGSYEMSVRFQNGSESLVEYTFPVSVESSAGRQGEDGTVRLAAAALIGVICGSVASFFIIKKKK